MLKQVASYTSEEEAQLDVQLEYAGPAASHPPAADGESPADGAPESWARRASASVSLLLRPSLQVLSVWVTC